MDEMNPPLNIDIWSHLNRVSTTGYPLPHFCFEKTKQNKTKNRDNWEGNQHTDIRKLTQIYGPRFWS